MPSCAQPQQALGLQLTTYWSNPNSTQNIKSTQVDLNTPCPKASHPLQHPANRITHILCIQHVHPAPCMHNLTIHLSRPQYAFSTSFKCFSNTLWIGSHTLLGIWLNIHFSQFPQFLFILITITITLDSELCLELALQFLLFLHNQLRLIVTN